MAFDYTSLALIKSYGNQTGTVNDTLLTDTLMPGYSRQIDRFCQQELSIATYSSQVMAGVVDNDGVMTCYPAVPTMTTPTAFSWRYGRSSTWQTVETSSLDVEIRRFGCVCRVLDRCFGGCRGQRISVRLSYTGGYADLASFPDDLVVAATRLTWWGYKLRDRKSVV